VLREKGYKTDLRREPIVCIFPIQLSASHTAVGKKFGRKPSGTKGSHGSRQEADRKTAASIRDSRRPPDERSEGTSNGKDTAREASLLNNSHLSNINWFGSSLFQENDLTGDLDLFSNSTENSIALNSIQIRSSPQTQINTLATSISPVTPVYPSPKTDTHCTSIPPSPAPPILPQESQL
jgi:hypothetical protein